MAQGLPRKIKFAFVVQALIGTVAIAAGLALGALAVREQVIRERLEREAGAYWAGRSGDPAFPLPHTATMTGVFVPAGAPASAVPAEVAGLSEGLHFPDAGLAVLVDSTPAGTLYVRFLHDALTRATVLMACVAGILALLVTWFTSWMTYRSSKRLVLPVNWLATVVSRWDPRAPDVDPLLPGRLPVESGTEVRQLAGALMGLAQRMGDFVQREREFTRDASHELRTPLTVIRVATDLMLADPEMPARAQRSLGRVQRAGRDMEAVIDAFLILAREAEVAPQSEEFAVADIVGEELDRVQPLAESKGLRLEVADEGAPRLHAPPHVLRVMIGNLLSNAVRFTDRGHVRVRMYPERIEIEDTGIGMSSDTLARAFEPFYRATFDDAGGKGMGLSIVRRLGERFGWPVTLRSSPGMGTLATIRFGKNGG